MTRVSTNLSIDENVKKESQKLSADLGMDLSTAVTVFLKQAIRVQGLPFVVDIKDAMKDTFDES